MRKKTTTSQRIRSLIDSGYNNKAIIEKLKCKPQAVYNIRYQLNKARGLGSIGELPNPTNGIGVPPKRTRRVKAGKLASLPPSGEWVDRHIPPLTPMPEMQITMVEPPTLWQRIKGWFRG
jgi:hypothetical protein